MFAQPVRKPGGHGTQASVSQRPLSPSHQAASYQMPPVLQLQRGIGNQAVLRFLAKAGTRRPAAAPRHPDSGAVDRPASPRATAGALHIGASDDALEREADRISDQVMRDATLEPRISSSPPQLSRKCPACEDEEEAPTLRMKPLVAAEGGARAEAPAAVRQTLRMPGEPLDPAARAFFEPRFGQDFAPVRIHADSRAAASARLVGAEAYAVGSHIAFDKGRYDPATSDGRKLLAHELAHVVQQSQNGGTPTIRRQPTRLRSPFGLSQAQGTPATDSASPQIISVPVTFTAILLDDVEPGVQGLSSVATGAGLGLHNLAFNDLSWLDSPLSFSQAYWGSLLPQSGVTLERGLSSLPRSLSPPLETFLANPPPGSPVTWLNSDRTATIEFQPDPASPVTRPFSAEELLSIEGLVRRYNANPASLSPAELQLLREAARIHISGSTPTSPFSSYSRPGELPPWVVGNKRYIVRVNVDRAALLDVSQPNAFNQGAEAITNVEEAEFLVVGDQQGRIISVQTVESLRSGGLSWAARNATAIRWGGRLLLVASFIYSGYRIASAAPEERARVASEEVGGQIGGIGGGALATAGCIALGIVTEGFGLLLCGLVGGAVGGGVGSYLGGKVADWAADSAGSADVTPDTSATDWKYRKAPAEVQATVRTIESNPISRLFLP